ncbi:MAG TPA: hypothetical protein VN282_02400 [Pyrinomonadaceae bacterium]|nr:hypothetical protein [Pyrinomonadaceae bacterium]
MGRYCKAYLVERFREFGGWKENLQHLKQEKPQGGMRKKKSPDGTPEEAPPAETRQALADGDHLYLQENFVVTDGIFMDENVVFDEVTPEWISFCENELKFEIPADDTTTQSSQSVQ